MEILVLGGTARLGREFASQALARGHRVTCLARGESGNIAPGAKLVKADRRDPGAYHAVADQSYDAVLDVSWQPRFVREAVSALGAKPRQWIYVSSVSAYASHGEPGADESAALLPPTTLESVDAEQYGEAKSACEEIIRTSLPDRFLIARAGLIGGPGDASGRSGYWVARAARAPLAPMLVPDVPDMPTQTIDARDLARWLVDTAEQKITGIYNTVGPVVPFAEWVSLSRAIGGHSGPLVPVGSEELLRLGVAQYMGLDSLPMWLADPGTEGFAARDGSAAAAAGLCQRAPADMITDILRWEREQGLDRPRRAGLSPEREAEILATLQ